MMIPRCGAKTRAGTPCQQKAGWGTNHVGESRCKLHGGKLPQVEAKYEIYRQYLMGDEQELFDEALKRQDLETEIAMLRIAFVRCFRSGTTGIQFLAPIARALTALLKREIPKPREHKHLIDMRQKIDLELKDTGLSEIGRAVLEELYGEAERALARGAVDLDKERTGPG